MIDFADLDKEYAEIKGMWERHLAKYGVRLPRFGTRQSLCLIYLYRNLNVPVALKDIRAFVARYSPEGSEDIQPRHLQYQGWRVLLSGKSALPLLKNVTICDGDTTIVRREGQKLPNGYVMLVDIVTPCPEHKATRDGSISAKDWRAILAKHGNACALCGKVSPFLEKGHKDPTKAFSVANVIPMCSKCNNRASNDFVYDGDGRIVALNSTKLVDASSLDVKRKIFAKLNLDKDVNTGARA